MSVERLLNVTNVSSVVSAINVTDVFTDDFDVYKIVSGNLLSLTLLRVTNATAI